MKVVINKTYGGFGLSKEARDLYRKKTVQNVYFTEDVMEENDEDRTEEYEPYIEYEDHEFRTDYALIEIVMELGERANGRHALLSVIEIPDDLNGEWEIVEYDGLEHIAEKHRRWF